MFLYWNLRAPYYENEQVEDRGAYLRDGFKTVSKVGICLEFVWPFKVSNVNKRPSPEAFENASERKVQRYERVWGTKLNTHEDILFRIKKALYLGYPVLIGMQIGKSFGRMPNIYEEQLQYYRGSLDPKYRFGGYHAMVIVGYDDEKGAFLVENSWGRTGETTGDLC